MNGLSMSTLAVPYRARALRLVSGGFSTLLILPTVAMWFGLGCRGFLQSTGLTFWGPRSEKALGWRDRSGWLYTFRSMSQSKNKDAVQRP